ncbi:RAD55 family ATPase [Halomicrobium urmianum]|uniref:RAD55 family ATPase n=1 Tax=Halomicrobium urmianum TaxID=1586233 RepID=UPI00402BC3DE
METGTDLSETMYDLSTVLDFDALESVRPGTSLLIAGPAMSGKEAIAFDVLKEGARGGEGAVVVTTNDRAASVVDEFRTDVPELGESQLGVVDCRGDGVDADESGAFVHHVSSPGDLTGIGIGITKALEGLHKGGRDRGRLALVSLSTMLTYTDKKTVFKLCHILSSRLDSAGYVGVFTIDSGAHDDQTLQVIKQAFDGLVEIRENEGAREARVMGLSAEPSDWQDL